MKSGCVSDSRRAAGRRLAAAYQTALANFGSQARQPSPGVPDSQSRIPNGCKNCVDFCPPDGII
jgi:hypothetical protein